MKAAWKVCAVLFLATALVGANRHHDQTKEGKSLRAITAADVQSLKDAIAAQQAR